jgi:hypothetical protein
MIRIIPDTERQGRSNQLGGWQDLARRRYQTGSIRKRGFRDVRDLSPEVLDEHYGDFPTTELGDAVNCRGRDDHH